MAKRKEKILVVEDDRGISDFVISELNHEGFNTILAETGRQALDMFYDEEPALVLLDIMIPELNGLEVLRKIRETSTIPVIVETARSETIDKINGLNSGADDYISKPYEIEELLARIKALLRRVTFERRSDIYCHKNLTLNPGKMSLSIDYDEVVLSKTEFLILKYFFTHKEKAVTRGQVIDNIWGSEHYIDENTIDVYVGYIRGKIAKFTNEEYIKTVRGVGYMLV